MALRANVAVSYFDETTNLVSSVPGTLGLDLPNGPTAATGSINPGTLVVGQTGQETKDLALYLDRSIWRNDDTESRDLVMRHQRQPVLLTQ